MRHFRFAAVTAVLTVAGATVAGCSSSARTTTTTTHPATTPAPTTTLAPTTTAPIRATGSAALGTDAAAALVAAWQHNDRAQAATIADGIAVEGMWATPPGPIWLRGCTIDPSLPEGGCVYRTDSGLVQINTEKRAAGWVVSSVAYDPLDDGSTVSGNAPDGPPPTTTPPATPAPAPSPTTARP